MTRKLAVVPMILALLLATFSTSIPAEIATNNAADERKTLLIYCTEFTSDLLGDTVSAWKQMHPEISISVYELSPEQIREALDSQNADVDLFLIASNEVSIDRLLRNNQIHFLESTALAYDIKTMYPQMQEYVMHEGAFWGYPVHIRTMCWNVNPELLEQFGLGEIPRTMGDYFSMLEQWYSKGLYLNTDYAFSPRTEIDDVWEDAVSDLIISYLHSYDLSDKQIDFDTPVFRSMLQTLCFLKDCQANSFADAQISQENQVFPHIIFSPFDILDSDQYTYMLPPAFTADTPHVLNGYMDLLVVSARSRNPELAEAFIELYSENGDPALKGGLYPYLTVTSPHHTSSAIAEYQYQIAHVCFDHGSLIGALFHDDQISRIMARLFEGTSSIDETIEALNQRLDLVSNNVIQ